MKLTEQELGEIRALHQIVKLEQWKLLLAEQNTAVFHNYEDWIKTQKCLLNLINNEKENFISQVCHGKGIKGKVSIDLETGNIIEYKANG